ncbi:hypothetical protein MJO55_04400 [Mycolicibacterium rufum]|uniref:Uncharacterized protein n=1 Tax=Mycolicibacterium rufum TaxID=318424 RepID=A0A9X2YCQ0_9MYCO|nr:hypothetical protein [Mycolicibacterium rufum]MCV7071044.1 hypothetical protein [Mycolicibacterium rufum]ULP37684.1 hypothetical protein MJO55_04400 [Mycolicibacterium rufum]
MSPRDDVLLRGLVDWVALDQVHWLITQARPHASVADVQEEVILLIRDLVAEGLMTLGNVDTESGFTRWPIPLDEAMDRVRRVYVVDFGKSNVWPWFCWLDLTEKGDSAARQIQDR